MFMSIYFTTYVAQERVVFLTCFSVFIKRTDVRTDNISYCVTRPIFCDQPKKFYHRKIIYMIMYWSGRKFTYSYSDCWVILANDFETSLDI